MKKSAIVRNMIATAKAQGLTAQDIIGAVISDLGFQRQLARTYVKNNWDKVAAAPAVAAAAPAVEAAAPAAGLSMSKDAVRKREARARAKAAKEIAAAEAAGCEMDPVADPMEDVNQINLHADC
jgi:hypothetical protein